MGIASDIANKLVHSLQRATQEAMCIATQRPSSDTRLHGRQLSPPHHDMQTHKALAFPRDFPAPKAWANYDGRHGRQAQNDATYAEFKPPVHLRAGRHETYHHDRPRPVSRSTVVPLVDTQNPVERPRRPSQTPFVRVVMNRSGNGACRLVISGRMADVCAELDRMACADVAY